MEWTARRDRRQVGGAGGLYTSMGGGRSYKHVNNVRCVRRVFSRSRIHDRRVRRHLLLEKQARVNDVARPPVQECACMH